MAGPMIAGPWVLHYLRHARDTQHGLDDGHLLSYGLEGG